jgi:hypothetical protein
MHVDQQRVCTTYPLWAAACRIWPSAIGDDLKEEKQVGRVGVRQVMYVAPTVGISSSAAVLCEAGGLASKHALIELPVVELKEAYGC